MKDENFRLLVLLVAAILVVSLLMNGFLAADPASVSGPPVRLQGYLGADGKPVAGYYIAGAGAQAAPVTAAPDLPARPTL